MTDTGILAAALEQPMEDNDADAVSVIDYLRILLSTLWEEDEGFSGKRPFGNSDWQGEVCGALCAGGFIDSAEQDTEGYWNYDTDEADSLVQELIDFVFRRA